jgi:hypothetical protein
MRIYKLALAVSLAATLAACGGGGDENETMAATFQTYAVDVSSQTVKAGDVITGVAEFKTYGPLIESVRWEAMETTQSVGLVTFGDPDCSSPLINNRDVAGTERKSSYWKCETPIFASYGTKGNFRVIATAIDTNGNTAKDEILVTVNPR